MTYSTAQHILQRWAEGERIHPLPAREGVPAPAVSFAFFPHETTVLESQLCACIERLAILQPARVSVTYEAGGATREHIHLLQASGIDTYPIPRLFGVKHLVP